MIVCKQGLNSSNKFQLIFEKSTPDFLDQKTPTSFFTGFWILQKSILQETGDSLEVWPDVVINYFII